MRACVRVCVYACVIEACRSIGKVVGAEVGNVGVIQPLSARYDKVLLLLLLVRCCHMCPAVVVSSLTLANSWKLPPCVRRGYFSLLFLPFLFVLVFSGGDEFSSLQIGLVFKLSVTLLGRRRSRRLLRLLRLLRLVRPSPLESGHRTRERERESGKSNNPVRTQLFSFVFVFSSSKSCG